MVKHNRLDLKICNQKIKYLNNVKNLNCNYRKKYILLKINQWNCFFEHLILISGIKKMHTEM